MIGSSALVGAPATGCVEHTCAVATWSSFVIPDPARAALVRLGEDPSRIDIETMPNDPGNGCQAGRVCKQSPEPGNPGYAENPMLLDLGPAGAGAGTSG